MLNLLSHQALGDVSAFSRNVQIAGLVTVAVTVSLFPEIALATVDSSATSADGLKYIPKLIQDTMNDGGTALFAIGGAVLGIGSMAFSGITVPKAAGAGAIGAAAGYGVPTVLGISGAAIF